MATIRGDSTNNILSGTNSADTISGDEGNDTLSGGNGNDLLLGGAGDDVIDGGNGNDLILGGSGEDLIYGGNGNDLVFGGFGDDVLFGNNGNDVLEGGGGNDTLNGGNGQDMLLGDSGDDVLIGAGGADWMMGGAGYDVFAYLNASDSNSGGWDCIIDFTLGEDKIDLSALHETNLAWGDKIAAKYTAWYQNFDSSTFVFADINGDGKADLQIELKNTSGLKLTSSDFMGVGGSAPVATNNTGTALEAGVAAGNDAIGNVLTDGVPDSDAGNGTNLTVSAIRTGTEAGGGTAGAVGSSLAGAYGTLTLLSNGEYRYTVDNNNATVNALNTGGSVTDTFTYTVSNGAGGTDTAQLTVTVNGTNDAAVLSSDTSDLAETNDAADISTSGTLTISDADSAETFVAQTDTAGTFGSFSIGTDGTWAYTADSAHNEFAAGITYIDSFNVTSADGTHTSVTINILGTNDAPVIASGDQSGIVFEGDDLPSASMKATGQVTFTDVDLSDTHTLSVNSAATHGSASVDADGTWHYTVIDSGAVDALAVGKHLSDSFTVMVDDGNGGLATQVVSIDIAGTNDTPDATADSADAINNGDTSLADAWGNALTNDTDPDTGDTLVATGISSVVGGTVGVGDTVDGMYGMIQFDNEEGEWSYWLSNASINKLAQGAIDYDVFHYTMEDQHGAVSSSTLTIKVTGTGTEPVPADPTPPQDVSPPVSGNSQPAPAADNVITSVWAGDQVDIPVWALLANDNNANGNPLGIESVGSTTSDDLVNLNGGYIEFTDANEFEASSFTYVATDGSSSGNPVVVNLTQDTDGTIDGTSGNDILLGARNESTTFAGNGGDDLLFGGNYADTFDYNALSDRGTTGDVISGFQKGSDDLDLHDLLATFSGYSAADAFSGGYLQFVESGNDTLVQVDGNGGGDSFDTLLTLNGVHLSSSDTGDFIL